MYGSGALCVSAAAAATHDILSSDRARVLAHQAADDVKLSGRAVLQRTVRGAFSECTVLTVAHRLHTIIDYDRILVLEAGQALEFGSPQELMQVSSARCHNTRTKQGQRTRGGPCKACEAH